jgi:hypothetical protein
VARRACARLGAPVSQAPAAQEHDEPEPGTHCRCCRPLRGLLLACPKLPCASPAGLLQPELTRPAVRGNFGFRCGALRVPSGTGWGALRLPRDGRTTPRAGGR